MWALILIFVTTSAVDVQYEGLYNSMADCFDGRDNLLVEGGYYDGKFPPGQQAVCIVIE